MAKSIDNNIYLIQQAIENPVRDNILRVVDALAPERSKEHKPSTFSLDQLEQDLKNPKSLTSKYFKNIVDAFLSREEEARKVNLQQMLHEAQKKLAEEEAILMELEAAEAIEREERLELEHQEIMVLEQQLAQTEQHIMLNKAKADELSNWSMLLSPSKLKAAQTSIQNRYDRIAANLAALGEALQREDLTDKQKAELKDYADLYNRHLELSTSFEKMKKFVGDQMNDETGLQVLAKNEMHEELYQTSLKRIVNRKSFNEIEKEDPVAQRCEKLSLGLNSVIEKYFEKHEVGGHPEGLLPAVKLLETLAIIKGEKPDVAEAALIRMQIDRAIETMSEDKEYSEIVDFLKKWRKGDNSAELSSKAIKGLSPPWTQFVDPLVLTPPQALDYAKEKLYEAVQSAFDAAQSKFDKAEININGINVQRTSYGFKFAVGKCRVHFDLADQKLVMSGFDPKISDKISEKVSEVLESILKEPKVAAWLSETIGRDKNLEATRASQLKSRA
jgi:hypothetical protein